MLTGLWIVKFGERDLVLASLVSFWKTLTIASLSFLLSRVKTFIVSKNVFSKRIGNKTNLQIFLNTFKVPFPVGSVIDFFRFSDQKALSLTLHNLKVEGSCTSGSLSLLYLQFSTLDPFC